VSLGERVTVDTKKKEPCLFDGPHSFKDLVDIEQLRKTFERFSQATGFTTGIASYPEQELLIGTGWRDICTKFHRACPVSEVHCKQSNLDLTSKLEKLKELNVRPCENGLVDGATPIIVEDMHLASLFTGQILFEKPNIEQFKKQAEDYGYDVEAYLEALNKVPIVNENKFRNVMAFLCDMAVMLAEAGLRELRLHQMGNKSKQVEEALKESERKYRLMADNVTDVIWTLGMDLKFTYISPAVQKLRGYTPEEAVQVPLEQTFTPESYQKVVKIFVQEMDRDGEPGVLADRSVVLELDSIGKDGGVIPVEVNASFFRDETGSPAGIIGITRDITERKRTEKALQKSEAKFRSIFENKGTATGIFGENSIIRECNAVFEELSGYSKSEIINKMKWSDLVVKEDLERMQKFHAQRSKSGDSPPTQYECGIVDRNGQIVPVIVNINLVGKDRIVSLTDITARKQAEDEREKLQAQLNHAQKMESLGTLAGGIAHDFNNLLSAILGYSELVLMDLPLENSIRPKVEAIHSSGIRARDLVAQILAFSRKDDQVRSPIELKLIVKDALKILRPAIPSTIDIQTKIVSDCRIMGDPSRVHQIIMNLCTNAYQAMLETGGTLGISLSQIKMEGKAAAFAPVPVGLYGKLVISDTGAGIPPEKIKRIFEPYFTTKEKGKGTGLGLAAVHGIVESHGGTILVKSQIGKGTTFEVYLPTTQDKKDNRKQVKTQLLGGNERILLIDDETDVLEIEKEMLEKLGYNIKGVNSAREALNLFSRHPDQFDIVITDMTMPDMTGDKLAGKLRKIRSDIRIVLITGFSELISKEQAVSEGINGFLMKPVQLFDMAKMVRKVLDAADGTGQQ